MIAPGTAGPRHLRRRRFRDDSIRVAKKACADGISVTVEVWPGMFHVFQSHEPLLPEARAPIDHIGEFVRSSRPRK